MNFNADKIHVYLDHDPNTQNSIKEEVKTFKHYINLRRGDLAMSSNEIVIKNEISKLKKSPVKILKVFKDNGQLYLMALPAVVLLFLFSYLPMGGIIIAFKDFQFSDGILGSAWMKPLFSNFNLLFKK